ncbi:MAG TPA: helix-hairpin-helix domain-containing protein [Prolixibacteraceae bacterium]|nr:helix-hairpin-helix domain-containing protein [Prolixibacteraceae bacterium]
MKLRKTLSQMMVMSKAEQNGVVVLMAILFLIIVFRFFIPVLFKNDESYAEDIQRKIAQMGLQEELAKSGTSGVLSNESNLDKINTSKNLAKSTIRSTPINYFKFDPNKINKEELLKLGFSDKMAVTFINYRSKGGMFYKPADLLKVYSVDSALYHKLEPYIDITPIRKEKTYEKVVEKAVEKVTITDEKPHYTKRKFEIIEINSADSTLLTSLAGIGPVFASRICNFRNKLGGFVVVDQLKQVYNFPEETYQRILPYITIDTLLVSKININFANTDELKQHPYCNYENARKIIEYRSVHGQFQSVSLLLSNQVVSAEVYSQLKQYLTVN